MKTLEDLLSEYEFCDWLDRDRQRIAKFTPEEMLPQLGYTLLPECVGTHVPMEFTRENILLQLKSDVEFGFCKALSRRGWSAELQYDVVRMFNWILQEGLEDFDDYKWYGLPLFKATAVKYGFDNPIGDDLGNEDRYRYGDEDCCDDDDEDCD